MDILTIILILITCAFIASPLFRTSEQKPKDKVESQHKQSMIQNTIDELTLDYETGKLSKQDYDVLVQEHRQPGKQGHEFEQQKARNMCTKCGHKVNKDDKFCSNCGTKL